MSIKTRNILLIAGVIVLAIVPLVLAGMGIITGSGGDAPEFGGSDGQAEEVIVDLNPDYEPWFESIYEPPSGEIESLLFALQAAIGAGVIGYYLGSRRPRGEAVEGADARA